MCHNFKIWIHTVVQLDKRGKAYKAQAHCLTYALTGLHKMFHPRRWPFTLWSHSHEIEALHGRTVVCLLQEQLGYLTKYIIRWNQDLKSHVGMSVYRHLKFLLFHIWSQWFTYIMTPRIANTNHTTQLLNYIYI